MTVVLVINNSDLTLYMLCTDNCGKVLSKLQESAQLAKKTWWQPMNFLSQTQ